MAVSIPRSPADVTPEFLTAALGTNVTAVEAEPIGTGQTGATYRLTVTYARDVDLPPTFAVKLPSQDETVRERVALGYRAEHAFYTRIAESVRVPMPRMYYCDISDDGGDIVLLLADMAPAVQGDQIGGCDATEAELAVRAIAGLHGPTWCDPAWADFPGLVMPLATADIAKGMGDLAVMATQITLDRLGDRMADENRSTATQSMAKVTPWLLAEPGRFSLMHGDYRLDNLLFTPDRTAITVVDWQTLGAGLPARDLAYFTATSLLPDLRAELDEHLVAAYHDELLGYGVTDYDRDACWRDYRLGMLQAPLITTLGCAFAGNTERGDEMMRVMLERGCQAIRDLDSMDLITRR
ncbi:phosphotransferase family protein [Mycolicibacterium sediminis]|uniref:Aminoglycoside phosphotransferase n=1 Tax=Mycolicibacterium sediminis TaxID=1286180 RepID=A0A7I7QVW8_9MYCO|nr:aminoglycoside phosphotransferase family protein [Mycolicibacterium sediminis]BBY30444.1 aminoglycoside phosphotransferase [Mycolicibacterium sediminis]